MTDRLVWNKELKKLGAGFALLFLAGTIVINIGISGYCSQIREEYKNLLAAVLGNMVSAYPDVKEEELIQVLSGKENNEAGERILAGYGVFEGNGVEAFSRQEGQFRFLQTVTNVLMLVLFVLCGVFLAGYFRKRQQRIGELESYMEILNREGYRMDLEENADDELSGLRNEIYKLTVLLKEQAAGSERQKRSLADSVANISHQLKTPLTSITILLDNLNEDDEMEPETRKHFMSEIMYQLTGMSWLIAAMLKLSRLDAGVVELEKEKLRISRLVEEAVRKVEIAAEWNGLSFQTEVPEDAFLYADKKWTGEALANILKNAVEHSPAGGCVEITVGENDVYTQITVRDHGKGISEEEQKKLFGRFFRGSTSGEDSIGIGLALAKEIVEKQGGYISVESREGKGTCFHIKFIK